MAGGPRLTLVRQGGRGVASSAHQGVGLVPPNVRRALDPPASKLQCPLWLTRFVRDLEEIDNLVGTS